LRGPQGPPGQRGKRVRLLQMQIGVLCMTF
jgi:hypothetical protein